MKRQHAAWLASLAPTATGPLTEGERHIVDLLTAGDDERLTGVRVAFHQATDVDRVAPPKQFSIELSAFVPSHKPSSRSDWYVKDLVIRDHRLEQPLHLNLYLSTWSTPERPIGFTILAPRPAGMESPWPASLQADEWGYLAPDEEFTGTIPSARERTRDPSTFVQTRYGKPGKPVQWLKELLDEGGSAVEPYGAVVAEDLAALEERCGTALPREVKQFYRWSDGAVWAEHDVFGTDAADLLEEIPGSTLLSIATDIDGNGFALDLERATATTCPVVAVEREVDDVSPSFRAWLADRLANR